MEIRIPTQIIVYVVGVIGVIILTATLMGSLMLIERRMSDQKLKDSLREDHDQKADRGDNRNIK